ncbi:DUF4397 domain-containing protein [Haloarchaeobius sp. DT45]|uniref:DUF4397 domain-containing protein n=1 Tax=Haloarchaeobius sp. DT45 TaxID=3446116 RepID=UPI003F6C327A
MATRRTVVKLLGIAGGTAAFGGFDVAAQADDADEEVASRGSDPAAFRVFHAVPDGPAIDLLVNDFEVLEGFEYGQLSPYAEVQRGRFRLRTVLDVQTFAPGTVYGPEDTVRLTGGDYTVVVAGRSLPSSDAELLVFEDDNAAVERTEATFRLVHVSPDAGALNVRAKGIGRLARQLDFGEATEYETVPAGMLELTLRKPGSAGTLDVTLALAGGATYTVFAHGFLYDEDGAFSIGGERGFTLLPVVDDVSATTRLSLAGIPPLRGRGGSGRGPWGRGPWGRGGWRRRRRRGIHSPGGRGPAPGTGWFGDDTDGFGPDRVAFGPRRGGFESPFQTDD